MGRSTRPLLLALTALLGAGPAAAATSDLVLRVNQSQHIHLAGAAVNVVVSNPAIADVTVADAHSVIVIGRGVGVAQVTVLDRVGHELLDSRVIVPDPEDRVTLYRGVVASNLRCSPHCEIDTSARTSNPFAGLQSSSLTLSSTTVK